VNTAIYYSPKFLEHKTGPDHPESPHRLQVIIKELNQSRLLNTGNCALIEPKPASSEDLALVHKPDYIKLVQQTCAQGGGILDLGDTVVSSKSCETAFLAAGALVEAVNSVAKGDARNAFALVRPPGHHAGADYAWGFCIFNNIAIAASYLLSRLNFERVLIIDIDAHHGNGTQEIFYNANRVLYVSIHEDPTDFPGTGFEDEVGEGEGIGYTVNVPLPFRSNDEIYIRAFDEIVTPISKQFKPHFILVSAGFDAHYSDPVGALSISMKCYEEIFTKIVTLASQLCEKKLVAALEGGYSLNFLGRMVTAAIAKIANASYEVEDRSLSSNPRVIKKAEQVIASVNRIQSSFWKL
jgi:acetoin utilization deacetylase AcuC-like enzyme